VSLRETVGRGIGEKKGERSKGGAAGPGTLKRKCPVQYDFSRDVENSNGDRAYDHPKRQTRKKGKEKFITVLNLVYLLFGNIGWGRGMKRKATDLPLLGEESIFRIAFRHRFNPQWREKGKKSL